MSDVGTLIVRAVMGHDNVQLIMKYMEHLLVFHKQSDMPHFDSCSPSENYLLGCAAYCNMLLYSKEFS